MRKWIAICLFLLGSFAFAGVMVAQDAAKPADAAKAEPAAHYYRLRFVIEELDANGKPTNSRTYTTTVNTARDEFASIRSGSKIPIITGTTSADDKSPVNTQFEYIDMGVNIDARHAREVGDQLSLNLTAEISSMAAAVNLANLNEPVIRHNNWQAIVLVPIGKPTVVFTSDSLDSKGSMQMVVTATPVQ